MSLICVCSAHGSPGVTTTAVAMAGVWPEGRPMLLVEADPSGGMLAARLSLSDSPGLVSLAAAARHGLDSELVWRHAQQAADGLAVLVAPPSPELVRSALRDLAGLLVGWCRQQDEVDVLVDAGRLTTEPVNLPFLRHADRVLLVLRPMVDQLRSAAVRLEAIRGVGVDAGLLLVGETTYGSDEVESALGVPVDGVVAWDPHAATALGGGGSRVDVRRSTLVRSAASLVDRLVVSLHVENDRGEPADLRIEVEGAVS